MTPGVLRAVEQIEAKWRCDAVRFPKGFLPHSFALRRDRGGPKPATEAIAYVVDLPAPWPSTPRLTVNPGVWEAMGAFKELAGLPLMVIGVAPDGEARFTKVDDFSGPAMGDDAAFHLSANLFRQV